MVKEIRHNWDNVTEEQKQRIIAMDRCMCEAYRETIYEYLKEGKAIIEKDQFGRLVCTILPEKA
jgi:hypothetical protein